MTTTELAARRQAAELASSTDDLRRLRDAPPALPDVPVTLVSGAVSSRLGRRRRHARIGAHRAGAAWRSGAPGTQRP